MSFRAELCTLLQMSPHRRAHVSQMTPSTAHLHEASRIWADLRSGLLLAFHQICAPRFVEGASGFIHHLVHTCSNSPSVVNLHTSTCCKNTPERSSVSPSGRVSVDDERHLSPAEHSSYFRAVVFRSPFCVTQGRDFCFLQSEPSAELTCPHEDKGRTYFNAHAGVVTAVHTLIAADQHIVCREQAACT